MQFITTISSCAYGSAISTPKFTPSINLTFAFPKHYHLLPVSHFPVIAAHKLDNNCIFIFIFHKHNICPMHINRTISILPKQPRIHSKSLSNYYHKECFPIYTPVYLKEIM
jgi:hypothetical protein